MTPLEFIEFADWVIENRPIREFQLIDIINTCNLVVNRDRVLESDIFYIKTVGTTKYHKEGFILARSNKAKISKSKAKVAKQGALF